MSQSSRVAKNTGILYARMVITVFISLYVTRLVLAALGAQDFGLFNVVGGAIAMLAFLNGAMSAASQRFMSYAEGQGDFKKQKQIFNVSIVLHLLIAVVIVIILEIAGSFFFNGILEIQPNRIFAAKLIYQFLILSTFFTVISVPYDAVINAHENMLFVAILGIAEAILKLGIAIYITYTDFDKLISYGFLMALLAIILLLIRGGYCHGKYAEVEIKIRTYFSKPLFKEMTSFASWSFLGSSVSIISNYGQGIVLNMFFGTKVNAAQGISNQVSGQLSAFAYMMLKALNPVLAKSEGAGDRNLMIKAAMIGSKVSFFLLVLFFVPILIETKYILEVWLVKVPEFAIIFCQLLLIRNLIEQLFKTLASTISANGNIRNYQIFSSVLSVFPLVFSYFFFSIGFPPYSLYVIFIVYSIFASIIIMYFTFVNFQFPIKDFLLNVVCRALFVFTILLVVSILPTIYLEESILRFSLVVIICLICFPITIWFIGFTKSDKYQVTKLWLPLKNKIFNFNSNNKNE